MTMVAKRTAYEWAIEVVDRLRWRWWLRFNNGSTQLLAAYEAVDDVGDCLDAIESAVLDDDIPEAVALIALSRAAIKEHVKTLKGLL